MQNKKLKRFFIYEIDNTYFTFISGAVISMAVTMLLSVVEEKNSILLWFSTLMFFLSSFFWFQLSVFIQKVEKEFVHQKIINDGERLDEAWSVAKKNI